MSAEADLEAALLAVLQANAAVRGQLGDPIRAFGSAEGLPAYPYLEIGRHEVRPAGSDGVEAFEHRIDLVVVSRQDAPGGVRPALDAVRAALDAARPDIPGGRCVLMHVAFADVLAARRAQEVRGILRVRVVVERL